MMETEPRTYPQIKQDLQAVQEAIEYVENGALTMAFNSNKSHLEKARDDFQEAQTKLDEEFQVTTDDGKEVRRAPDGRPVLKVEDQLVYAEEDNGSFTATDEKYITEEDRNEVVQTSEGAAPKAQAKMQALRIYPTDPEKYDERCQELMETEKEVWVEPINREMLENDENVDTSMSPDLSSIMWMFKQYRETRSEMAKTDELEEEPPGNGHPEPAEA